MGSSKLSYLSRNFSNRVGFRAPIGYMHKHNQWQVRIETKWWAYWTPTDLAIQRIHMSFWNINNNYVQNPSIDPYKNLKKGKEKESTPNLQYMLLKCLSPLSVSNAGQLQNHVLSELVLTQNFIVLFLVVLSPSTKGTIRSSEYYLREVSVYVWVIQIQLLRRVVSKDPWEHWILQTTSMNTDWVLTHDL